MKSFLLLAIPKMVPGGVVIVEDLQNISWVSSLTESVPESLRPNIRVFDRRAVKNRYDDILFVVEIPEST